jgi:hypothetical protein
VAPPQGGARVRYHRAHGRTITARAEVINLFDRPEFMGPNVFFGTPEFGQILGEGGLPRTVQVLARVAW